MCRKRHRHQEWLSFLRLIDRETPKELDLHLVCDNYATRKHAKVQAWVATNPRIHLHFTPTYTSRLNQVEPCFALLSEQAINRQTFHSVTDLKRKMIAFCEHYNESPKPFVWVATIDSIFEKLEDLSTHYLDDTLVNRVETRQASHDQTASL